MRTPLHQSLKRPLQRPLTLTHGLGYPVPQDASRRPNTRRKRPQELLASVRAAWGMPCMAAWQAPEGHWMVVGVVPVASGATEAEALIAALEAAP
jgi:hypothetical protein